MKIIQSRPVQTNPVQSSPVQSSLVQSSPVQSSPVQSSPVQSSPVQSSPVQSSPVQSSPVQFSPVQSRPVQSNAYYESLCWRMSGNLVAGMTIASAMFKKRHNPSQNWKFDIEAFMIHRFVLPHISIRKQHWPDNFSV